MSLSKSIIYILIDSILEELSSLCSWFCGKSGQKEYFLPVSKTLKATFYCFRAYLV